MPTGSVMSRTFTLTDRQSVLTANYYPPIELKSDAEYGLGLIGLYTYNSILTLTKPIISLFIKGTTKL